MFAFLFAVSEADKWALDAGNNAWDWLCNLATSFDPQNYGGIIMSVLIGFIFWLRNRVRTRSLTSALSHARAAMTTLNSSNQGKNNTIDAIAQERDKLRKEVASSKKEHHECVQQFANSQRAYNAAIADRNLLHRDFLALKVERDRLVQAAETHQASSAQCLADRNRYKLEAETATASQTALAMEVQSLKRELAKCEHFLEAHQARSAQCLAERNDFETQLNDNADRHKKILQALNIHHRLETGITEPTALIQAQVELMILVKELEPAMSMDQFRAWLGNL